MQLATALETIKLTADRINENVILHRRETNSQTALLQSMKTANGAMTVSAANAPLYSQVVAGQDRTQTQTPRVVRNLAANLGGSSKKRRRTNDGEVSPTPTKSSKSSLRKRPLMAGTGGEAGHGLGDPVQISSKVTAIRTASLQLENSMYVSRLQPTVTVANMLEYIKQRVPTMNENDIALRMLVKRDQPLHELTFISFRISCSSVLYAALNKPAFWPSHVMIGEFIERPRPKSRVDGVNLPPTVSPSTVTTGQGEQSAAHSVTTCESSAPPEQGECITQQHPNELGNNTIAPELTSTPESMEEEM